MTRLFILFIMIVSSMSAYPQEHYMFTGTYTKGTSRGIYVHAFDTDKGSARLVDSALIKNPSYMALSPDEKYLYAVNEEGKNEGGGKVSAFSFNKKTGKLTYLNSQPSMGDHPCYITVDKTGKWVIVGNYSSGSLAVLPVEKDGSLGKPVSVARHEGSSINKDRQGSAHVHATVLSSDNKWLYVPDLGIDQVVVYGFDEKTGAIARSETKTLDMEKGAGPRHFEFHPTNKWAYLLQELAGTVVVFKKESDRLEPVQTISSLPKDFQGTFTSADIHVSPDGRFLYASNRDESNTIAIFSVDQKDGKLSLADHQSTLGKTPRNFSFDPTGKFLLAANQNSDNIVVFSIDETTGLLTDSGQRIEVGSPVCIRWAGLK